MNPIDQAEHFVSELADAHAMMDEAEVPRFDSKTGLPLTLKERIDHYAKGYTAKQLIEMLSKSVDSRRNLPPSPFDGPSGRSPFDR